MIDKNISMRKLLILLFFILFSQNYFGQKVIKKQFTSFEEIDKWNKSLDSLKSNFLGDYFIDSTLVLLNEFREENKVGGLTLSETLCKVAKLQSDYCEKNNTVIHKQEAEDLESCFKRGWKYGEYNVVGEVVSSRSLESSLFKNQTPPHIIIEGFKNSAGHAFVMKKPEYVRCGISIVQSTTDKDKYYTVIVFSNYESNEKKTSTKKTPKCIFRCFTNKKG